MAGPTQTIVTEASKQAMKNPAVAEFAGKVLGKGAEFLQAYWKGLEEPAKRKTLDYLTDRVTGARTEQSQNLKDAIPGTVERVQGTGGRKDTYEAYKQKQEGDYPSWASMAYENPLTTANLVGTAVPTAVSYGGAMAVDWLTNDTKPRSEYAAPVSPTRGSYNSSVESAQAAAYYKHQLEEQKFNHKMALMDAREQSRVPGTQPVSGSGATPDYGRGDISGMLNQLQNYRPQYF